MSAQRYKNPTALVVGKEGNIFGRSARVVGRSVLRSADRYQWDEYHLKLDDGSEITLVYESGIWKRFALFDPKTTINAQSAADLDVGDPVYLGDQSADISYVGQSRVLFIEGKAPEGYRVGSEAHYFNAEAGSRMFVVSWTGDEVEFYEGENLPRHEVERAFGLPEPSLLTRLFSGGSGSLDSWFENAGRLVWTIVMAAVFFVFLFGIGSGSGPATADPAPPTPAPALRLPARAEGDLDGHHYTVVGHRLNEIDEMRGRFVRHEYDLTDEEGAAALLIQGLSWNARQWYLFRPSTDALKIWPTKAAALKQGAVLNVEGTLATVRTLFLCRTVDADGDVPASDGKGSIRYGFTAQTKDGWVIARWDEADVDVLVGQLLSEHEIQQALGKAASH
jgi:hypothetical protein